MRPAALGAHDGLHVAIRVEADDRLRQVEVYRAAALALGVECERKLIHRLDCGEESGVCVEVSGVLGADSSLDLGNWYLVEDGLDERIGEASLAADDAFADLVAQHLASRIDLHDAAQDKTIFLWA